MLSIVIASMSKRSLTEALAWRLMLCLNSLTSALILEYTCVHTLSIMAKAEYCEYQDGALMTVIVLSGER